MRSARISEAYVRPEAFQANVMMATERFVVGSVL